MAHINPITSAQSAEHLRNMQGVLGEITVTYQVLLDVLQQQQDGLSLPATDAFRDQLITMVERSVTSSQAITQAVDKLAEISERASAHRV